MGIQQMDIYTHKGRNREASLNNLKNVLRQWVGNILTCAINIHICIKHAEPYAPIGTIS